MKKSHLAFVAVLVLLVAGYYLWRQMRGTGEVSIDLYALADTPAFEFRPGEKKGLMFAKGPETVGGVTRPAIFSHASSRLIFKKQVIPDHGRLRAWIAVREAAWTQDSSDGVLFRFAVADGRDYAELLNQHVDPRHNANDRGWLPVDIDLTAYAGQEVDLIFNTNTSLPRQGDNGNYDFALWGEPTVIDRP
jgi:hypothetical protein